MRIQDEQDNLGAGRIVENSFRELINKECNKQNEFLI